MRAMRSKPKTAEEMREPKSMRYQDDTASGAEKTPVKSVDHESYRYDWRQRKGLKRGEK